MKNYFKYMLIALFSVGLITSCTSNDETFSVSKGNADFSNYVAFGNSLTSGYADNALYYDGQIVSYPNLLAEQMQEVGGGEFVQPLVSPNSVGIGSSGNARLVLQEVNGSLAPVPATEQGDFSIFTTSVAGDGPFNNMGVPGATVTTSIYPGYGNPANGEGNYNPFFTRMTTDPAGASMLSDALAQNPSFFTVFIGNNDVLGYATSGGAGASITPMEGGPGVGFSASYDAVIQGFLSTGAKGAVANIPDVTSTAFFNYIPYNALVLEEDQAAQLNGGIDQMLGVIGLTREALAAMGILLPEFNAGPNPLFVDDEDPSNLMGIREMEEGELVLLTAQGTLMQIQQNLANAQEIFTEIAMALATQDFDAVKTAMRKLSLNDEDALTADEVQNIKEATQAFNSKIKSAAEANGLAHVDVNAFLKRAHEQGINLNGRVITTEFVTGGAFSLDGIHLTPIGNVLLANEFIKAINKTYEAHLPQVDPSHYGGVIFP